MGSKRTEYDEVFLIYAPKVDPAVMQGHRLGSTGWLSLCTVCRGRGVS